VRRAQRTRDDAVLNKYLDRLSHACRPLAPLLHGREVMRGDGPSAKRLREDVGGCDRVLDSKINADTADGGHGVRGVAEAQQTGAVPAGQSVDRDREQLDVVPAILLVVRRLGRSTALILAGAPRGPG
jgi:hypothetical protein